MGSRTLVFIDTEMTGVNQVTGQAGSLVAFLYQALVTGGPAVTLDSITRSGTTATASKNNHGFQMVATDLGQWIVVAGANETEYNGLHQITSVTATSFTYEVSGTPASPATGTITAKFAPLGWTRPYSGTNKAIFQGDDFSDGELYQFLDNATLSTLGAKGCAVRGAEGATDVDTLISPMPQTLVSNNYPLVVKSDAASSATRSAFIVGDGQGFYLGLRLGSSASYWYDFHYFGDCISETAGDNYKGCLLAAYQDSSGYTYPGYSNQFSVGGDLTATQAGKFKARTYTQDAGAIMLATVLNSAIHSRMGVAGMAQKNAANNGRHYAKCHLTDSGRIVGWLPGLYDLWHNTTLLVHKAVLDEIPGLEGRKILFLKGSYGSSAGYDYGLALDLTGPWRE